MKKQLAVALAALCLMSGCKANDYIEEGTEFLREGEYEEAVEVFQKAVEKEDRLDEAHRGIGLACYELKEYDAARENFQKALDLGATETSVIYNLIGVCSMNLNDYDGALEAFGQGIAFSLSQKEDGADDDAVVLKEMRFNQIICYEKKHDWERAKAVAEEYINDYPDDMAVKKEVEFLQTR